MEQTNTSKILSYDSQQLEYAQSKWYVLFVRSNQEKRVALHLRDREVEHFLPAYESVRQWRDRKVKLLNPLFPGYVFVRLPLTERLRAISVPNVVNLVGTRDIPSVISDEEIDWIKRGIESGSARPESHLKAGSRVVIKAGPMAGMEGILLRTQNSTRILISLNSISRAFTVEVDADLVEATSTTPAFRQRLLT